MDDFNTSFLFLDRFELCALENETSEYTLPAFLYISLLLDSLSQLIISLILTIFTF